MVKQIFSVVILILLFDLNIIIVMKSEEIENQLRESLISTNQQNDTLKQRNIFPQEKKVNGNSIFSALFFTWIYPLLSYGAKWPINVQHMPTLPKQYQTKFESENLLNIFRETERSPTEGFTLTKALFKAYVNQYFLIILFVIIYVGLSMFSPFLTSMVMQYIGQDKQHKNYSQGWFLFLLTLFTTFIKNLSQTQMSFKFSLLGLNMTNSLTMMIYNKSLRYGSICQKKFTQSDIINYSQVDAERMTYMGYQLSSLLFAPLQIIIGIIMMYNFIGISFLAGMGAMIFTISITYIVAKKSIKYNEEMLLVKDQRMKATQEMLDIIRFIKINAIQKFFFLKVNEKRMKEINLYKKKGFMDVLNIFVYWLACPLILSVTFFTYIKLGNQMNSQVAFTTIMIFSILQYPIRLLPSCISEIIQMFASVKRIEKYLLAEERKTQNILHIVDDENPVAIRIERGDFYWGFEQKKKEKEEEKRQKDKNKKSLQNETISMEQENKSESNLGQQSQNREIQTFSVEQIEELPPLPSTADASKYVHVLKDINTTIHKQKFTIIIGDIGSGKSSLLYAILNQMRSSKKSKIQINGQLAYASQKPWIMSATVKDNIIFTLPYDDAKFNRVIHYASLSQDIKILPNGVETEIGQKGVNLSGGQKARIGLARALYSEKNIYLLDDILSAVDVHVGQFLMKQTLLGYLKGKTIIMPTHAIKFAEFVDEIIIMNKGRIVRKGHYTDISQTPQFIEISLSQKKKSQSEKEQQQLKSEKELQSEMIKLKQVIKGKSSNNKDIKEVNDKIVQQLMLPEDHTVGKIDLTIFKEYIMLNGGYFRFAFLVSFAMLLWIVSTTMASIIMQRWCEDPIGQSYDLYIYMSLAIFSNFFIFFRAYTLVLSGAKQGQKVHKSMVKSLLYASLNNFYNRVPVGRIINRLTKDLRELDEAIGFAIGTFLVNFFSLLSTLTICVYSSTPWVLVPISIVLYFSNRLRNYYMKTQREVGRYEKSTNSPIVSGFMSAISGLSIIRAYNNQQGFTDVQFKQIDINKKVRFNKSALECWFSLVLTYLSFFVNMTAIGYCILSSNDNPSLAGLLMNYAINLSGDISYLILSFSYFQTKIISLQRIYTFMKINPEPAYEQYCLDWVPEEQGYQTVISKGQIQFKSAYIKYRKDLPPVLKDISCKIHPGEKIGIVGRTGAGKTTIINTLLRVTQLCGGDVLIDGNSLFQMPLKNLRNGITMIDQEPILIKSSFKTNLDLTGRYSDQQLLSILKECNLYETILQKGGLQGQVSNDSLSVGEKQLLCICRAFLKQSKIVLIDEATANIDLKNDEIIQKVITEKFKDCTVLTIAHRLSTLKNSDRILVMESGQILQMGTPQELQNIPNGYYKQMLKKNASEFLI